MEPSVVSASLVVMRPCPKLCLHSPKLRSISILSAVLWLALVEHLFLIIVDGLYHLQDSELFSSHHVTSHKLMYL